MSTIWIDCPTDGLTVSPPFCVRGGLLAGPDPVTLRCHLLCPGSDPLVFEQTVAGSPKKKAPATAFCFKVADAPECVVTVVVSLSVHGREEASVAVYDVSVVPSGGSDCQCPADCPSPGASGEA